MRNSSYNTLKSIITISNQDQIGQYLNPQTQNRTLNYKYNKYCYEHKKKQTKRSSRQAAIAYYQTIRQRMNQKKKQPQSQGIVPSSFDSLPPDLIRSEGKIYPYSRIIEQLNMQEYQRKKIEELRYNFNLQCKKRKQIEDVLKIQMIRNGDLVKEIQKKEKIIQTNEHSFQLFKILKYQIDETLREFDDCLRQNNMLKAKIMKLNNNQEERIQKTNEYQMVKNTEIKQKLDTLFIGKQLNEFKKYIDEKKVHHTKRQDLTKNKSHFQIQCDLFNLNKIHQEMKQLLNQKELFKGSKIKKIRNLEQELLETKTKLKNRDKQVEILKKDLELLQNQLKQHQNDKILKLENCTTNSNQSQQIQPNYQIIQQIKNLKQQNHSYQSKTLQQTQYISKLQQQNKQIKEQINYYLNNLLRSNEQLIQSTKLNQCLKQKIIKLKQKKKKNREQIYLLEQEIKQLRQSIRNYEQKRKQYLEQTIKFNQNIKELEQQIQFHIKNIKIKQLQYQKIKQQNKEYIQKISLIQRRYKQIDFKQFQTLKEQYNFLQNNLKQCKQRIIQKNILIQQMKQQMQKNEQKKQSNQQRNEQVLSQLKNLKLERKKKEKQNQILERQAQTFKKQVINVKKELQKCRKLIQKYRSRFQQLEQTQKKDMQIEGYLQQLEQIRKQKNQFNKIKSQQIINNLEKQLQILKQQLKYSHSQRQSILQQLLQKSQQKLFRFINQNKSLIVKIHCLEKKLIQQKDQCQNKFSKQMKNLKMKLKHQKKQNQRLKNQIQHMTYELMILREKDIIEDSDEIDFNLSICNQQLCENNINEEKDVLIYEQNLYMIKND